MTLPVLQIEDPQLYFAILAACRASVPVVIYPYKAQGKKNRNRRTDLLDAFATVIASTPKNPAAVVASRPSEEAGKSVITLYYTFNIATDEDLTKAHHHLDTLLSLFPQILALSGKQSEADNLYNEIVVRTHKFSWSIFEKRALKRRHHLELARTIFQRNRHFFTSDDQHALELTFKSIDTVLSIVDEVSQSGGGAFNSSHASRIIDAYRDLRPLKVLSAPVDEQSRKVPWDPADDHILLTFDRMMGFKFLQSLVPKMMSLVAASFRLYQSASSSRDSFLHGEIRLCPVAPLRLNGYTCILDQDTIQNAFDSAFNLLYDHYLQPSKANLRDKFVQYVHDKVLAQTSQEEIEHPSPVAHAEVTLATWIRTQMIEAYPYIAVSRLSCGACAYFVRAKHERTFVVASGSHMKYYGSWSCPTGVSGDIVVMKLKCDLLDVWSRFVERNQVVDEFVWDEEDFEIALPRIGRDAHTDNTPDDTEWTVVQRGKGPKGRGGNRGRGRW